MWTESWARVLRMSRPAVVQIIGAPIACSDGYRDAWRETADWASGQLKSLFGDSVELVYFDLFDPTCPALPPNAHLPLVMIDNQVLINGGKISIPTIRKRLQELGLKARPQPSA